MFVEYIPGHEGRAWIHARHIRRVTVEFVEITDPTAAPEGVDVPYGDWIVFLHMHDGEVQRHFEASSFDHAHREARDLMQEIEEGIE